MGSSIFSSDEPNAEIASAEEKSENTTNITATNSSVVVGCSGQTSVSNAPQDGARNDMEDEIMRVYRGLTMRERVQFMQNTYDYEDACNEAKKKGRTAKGKNKKPVVPDV